MASPITLIVEDDRLIATLLKEVLQAEGHQVLSSENAAEAMALGRLHQREIALLLCDVVLKDGTGPDVALRIKELCPGIRTLFISGYPLDALAERDLLTAETLRNENALYIQKPFRIAELLRLVESVFAGQTKGTTSGVGTTGALRVSSAH